MEVDPFPSKIWGIYRIKWWIKGQRSNGSINGQNAIRGEDMDQGFSSMDENARSHGSKNQSMDHNDSNKHTFKVVRKFVRKEYSIFGAKIEEYSKGIFPCKWMGEEN